MHITLKLQFLCKNFLKLVFAIFFRANYYYLWSPRAVLRMKRNSVIFLLPLLPFLCLFYASFFRGSENGKGRAMTTKKNRSFVSSFFSTNYENMGRNKKFKIGGKLARFHFYFLYNIFICWWKNAENLNIMTEIIYFLVSYS